MEATAAADFAGQVTASALRDKDAHQKVNAKYAHAKAKNAATTAAVTHAQ